MKNKKILHVTMYFYPVNGGQEVYIDNMNKFVFQNYDISILQPNYTPKDTYPKNIIGTFNLPLLNRFIHDFHWFFFNINLFFQKKNVTKSDLVIVHYAFHNNFINNKRKVIISHGVDWRLTKNTFSDRYRRKSAINLYKNLGSDIIVANDTNFLREIGVELKNTKAFCEVQENIWFVPNCIDTYNFYEDRSVKKEKIILCPRNIRWERGIHLAIEVFHKFHKFSKYKEYKLVILGGPLKGRYYNSCLLLVKKYELQDCINFNGSVDSETMKIYYRRSMLTIIPTIEQEGTSLSALESMACGTPVVSTSNGGLVDLPTVKSKTESKDMSEKIKSTLENYDQIKNNQMHETHTLFNMHNWTKAWRKITENAIRNG